MGIVREHDEEVLVVLPRQHRVVAIDLPGKERHAFVLHGSTVEGEYPEVLEILGLDELRQDGMSVVGRVGGVVQHRPVVLREAHEAGVFDAVALVGRDGEDDALAHGEVGREVHLVVGIGKPLDARKGVGETLRHGLGLAAPVADALIQLAAREAFPKRFHHRRREPVVEAHLMQLDDERRLPVAGIGFNLRHGDEAGDGVQADITLGIDEPGAELNGGDVPFPRGAQAHDEA